MVNSAPGKYTFKQNPNQDFLTMHTTSMSALVEEEGLLSGQVSVIVQVHHIVLFMRDTRFTMRLPDWPGMPAASRATALLPWRKFSLGKVRVCVFRLGAWGR